MVELFLLLYFGKNKIQYKDFDWKIAQSEHFKIFYYEGGEHLKDFAIAILEEAYEEYKNIMPRIPKDKIPVLIYNSAEDFRQTNVIFDLIDEGVGGFTEVFKNRIVVPYFNSYEDFKHVLRHELVHAFQYEALSTTGSILSNIGRVPLWVMEGMAEYLSIGWDITGETFMRDLVLNDLVVPIENLSYWGGYLIYKEGQAIYYFIEREYSREKLKEFISNILTMYDLNSAIRRTFGMELEEFSRKFNIFLKERYYPDLKEFKLPSNAIRITNNRKGQGYFNIAPAIDKDANKVIFISDRNDYTDIFISTITGSYQRKIISGQTKPDLENLHLLSAKISFSPDGESFVFSARGRGYDILYISDTKGKIKRKIEFKHLDGVNYPSFSKDKNYITFVGLKDGKQDIYIYNLKNAALRKITNDYFDDLFPTFDDEGNVYFVSDRNENNFKYGNYAIFKYNLQNDSIYQITPYLGKIYYFDLRNNNPVLALEYKGTVNVFEYKNNKLYQLTNFPSIVYSFSFDGSGNKMVINLQYEGAREIFYIPEIRILDSLELPYSNFTEFKLVDYKNYKYRTEFSLSWFSSVAIGFGSGIGGYVIFGFSDWTGDNWIIAQVQSYITDISNSTFFLDYLYLRERWDLNVSAYQYWSISYLDKLYSYTYDKILGSQFLIYYPFNRFDRLELGLSYNYYTRFVGEFIDFSFFYNTILYKNSLNGYIGFSRDKILYYPWGPVQGHGFFIAFQPSLPLSQIKNSIVYGDFRYYLRFIKRYTLAFRIIGYSAFGDDRESIILYGPDLIRGWTLDTLFAGNNAFITNIEFRFPFIEYLRLGFPISLTLSSIRGSIFYDIGAVWFDNNFKFFDGDSLYTPKSSFGFNISVFLGFGNIYFTWAWRTNLKYVEDSPRFSFYLGLDY